MDLLINTGHRAFLVTVARTWNGLLSTIMTQMSLLTY